MPRFYCNTNLNVGDQLNLPDAAARHVQVLRMQPGQSITLFGAPNGLNHEYTASIVEMGRQHVAVAVQAMHMVDREAAVRVHLLAGMPSNDRMDWLVEKATELGAASFIPIATERSMLKYKGERAEKKQAHWQSVAISACEQSGRNTVPLVSSPTRGVADWLKHHAAAQAAPAEPLSARTLYVVLTPQGATQSLGQWWAGAAGERSPAPGLDAACDVYVLTGPEGGLSESELAQAVAAGFTPVSLGARILRSETAPLAALSVLLLGA